MRFTLAEIAEATGGTAAGDPGLFVDGTGIDSRSMAPGSLFVPLVAERDGHDFIDAAMASGAGAHLSQRAGGTHPHVVVADTLAAFGSLGRAARARLPDAVIGITGSVGKTSVKDLLAAVLDTSYRTAASAKSFNNEIGVPLTLTNAPGDTEVVVQEMGARGIGHIAELCAIARPTGAVITRVAEVHTSEFASLAEVARGKGELAEAVGASGFVVLNGTDDAVRSMASRTAARVVTYGTGIDAAVHPAPVDVTATNVRLDDDLRAAFELHSPWGTIDVALDVHGVHQVDNALAAAAAALAQGVALDAVPDGLRAATLSPWRMELGTAPSGARILNDAYNANPTAMAAALASLAALPARRRIAVVGLMAELGDVSDARHHETGRLAAELGIEVVSVACPAYGTGVDVADIDAAADHLADLGDGDAVLVKASRSVGLERLADRLLNP